MPGVLQEVSIDLFKAEQGRELREPSSESQTVKLDWKQCFKPQSSGWLLHHQGFDCQVLA